MDIQKAARLGSLTSDEPAPVDHIPFALLENAIVRLDRIASRLNEANKITADLRTRTFGPWPGMEQAGEPPCTVSVPSQQSRIYEMIERLEGQALEALEQANALATSL